MATVTFGFVSTNILNKKESVIDNVYAGRITQNETLHTIRQNVNFNKSY